MASIPEQSELECKTIAVRLVVAEGDESQAVEDQQPLMEDPTSCSDTDSAKNEVSSMKSEETTGAPNTESSSVPNAEVPSPTANHTTKKTRLVRFIGQDKVDAAKTFALRSKGQPQQIPAIEINRKQKRQQKQQEPTDIESNIRGGISFAATIALTMLLSLVPIYAVCPYMLPPQLWTYGGPNILFSAMQYSATLSILMAWLMASIIVVSTTIRRTFFSSSNYQPRTLDVTLNKHLAFELAMASVAGCNIERAHERAGQITIVLRPKIYLDIRVESISETESRIHLSRRFDSMFPGFFWENDLHKLMTSYVSVNSDVPERIETYINAHAPLFAGREFHEDLHAAIDYQPRGKRKKPDERLILVAGTVAATAFLMLVQSNSPAFFPSQARYEMKNHNLETALTKFNQALANQPNSRQLLAERGFLLLTELNAPAEAERDFRRAMDLGPLNFDLASCLQASLIQQNRLDEVQALDNLIAANLPETAEALNNRAWHQAISGNYDDALASSNSAISLDPSLDAAWGTRGWINHLVGEEQQAIADYVQAINLNPSDKVDYKLLGQSLRIMGDSQQADFNERIANDLGFKHTDFQVPPTFDEHGDPPIALTN